MSLCFKYKLNLNIISEKIIMIPHYKSRANLNVIGVGGDMGLQSPWEKQYSGKTTWYSPPPPPQKKVIISSQYSLICIFHQYSPLYSWFVNIEELFLHGEIRCKSPPPPPPPHLPLSEFSSAGAPEKIFGQKKKTAAPHPHEVGPVVRLC